MDDTNNLTKKVFGISEPELKVAIANEIKNMKLNDILDEPSIDSILKDMVFKKSKNDAMENVQMIIPEDIQVSHQPVNPDNDGLAPAISQVYTNKNLSKGQISEFPSQEELEPAPSTPGVTGDTSNYYTQTPDSNTNIDQGVTGNINSNGNGSYKPKLPTFLDQIEHAKVLIFNQNEVTDSGESLASKPFRLLENPEIKENINDFWINKGIKTTDVYICRPERIGEITFDYSNGTAIFREHKVDLENNPVNNYHTNPYKAIDGVELPVQDEVNLEKYIKSSIDLDKVVSNIVKNILQVHFSTNQTKAVNDTINQSIEPVVPVVSASSMKQETTLDNPDGPGYGLSISDTVKPMEESINKNIEFSKTFSFKITDIVNNFRKVELPKPLIESLKSQSTQYLNNKNEEVEEFLYEGMAYYLPVEKISYKKGYIKLNSDKKSQVL